MQQLSATDATFLYAETPRTPMHVAALQLYDPATAPTKPVSIEQIREHVRCRAHRIDCYHRKLLETPWRLDHPQWIDDGSFDVTQHFHAHTLPEPGGWRALCEMVARLDAQLLNRNRPLWEMHVITALGSIDGIPADAFAVLTKIHHAAVDGVAGIGVTLALHDLDPVGPTVEPGAMEVEQAPTPMQLMGRALAKESLRGMRFYQAWPALARMATAGGQLPGSVAPLTRFDGRVREQRVFDAIRLPLSGLEARKKLVANATINDVLLTIVGGAMRRYLQSHGELPQRTLTAMVPRSMRSRSPQAVEGNRISQLTIGLGTDIAGARDRLRMVQDSTARAKVAVARIDGATLEAVSALQPAWWVALAASEGAQAASNRAFNTVVTNVAGPQVPLYLCGAKLLSAYGAGPLADGMGIFHTALSYCGELYLSVLACAEHLPDVEFYLNCLRLEYEAF